MDPIQVFQKWAKWVLGDSFRIRLRAKVLLMRHFCRRFVSSSINQIKKEKTLDGPTGPSRASLCHRSSAPPLESSHTLSPAHAAARVRERDRVEVERSPPRPRATTSRSRCPRDLNGGGGAPADSLCHARPSASSSRRLEGRSVERSSVEGGLEERSNGEGGVVGQ